MLQKGAVSKIISEPIRIEDLVKKQSGYNLMDSIQKNQYANIADDVEYVSPYVIKNECGYPIEIKDSSNQTYLI